MNIRRMTTGLGIVAASAAMVIASAGAAQADPGSRQALNALVTSGVLTQVQLDAFTAEKNDLKDTGMNCTDATVQALNTLVSNGTLSRDEADAIQAAKGGSRGSSAGGSTTVVAQGATLQTAPVPDVAATSQRSTARGTATSSTARQGGVTQDRRQVSRTDRGGRAGR